MVGETLETELLHLAEIRGRSVDGVVAERSVRERVVHLRGHPQHLLAAIGEDEAHLLGLYFHRLNIVVNIKAEEYAHSGNNSRTNLPRTESDLAGLAFLTGLYMPERCTIKME